MRNFGQKKLSSNRKDELGKLLPEIAFSSSRTERTADEAERAAKLVAEKKAARDRGEASVYRGEEGERMELTGTVETARTFERSSRHSAT